MPHWPGSADDVPRILAPSQLSHLAGGAPRQAQALASLAGPTLQLNQAVQMAVGWHPSIAANIALLGQQAAGVSVARAGYYPQVRLGVGSSDSNTQIGNGPSVSATISQTLYDFGKVSGAVDQAQALVNRQQALVLKQIDEIAQQTAEAIVNAHRYQTLETIAVQQVDTLEQVLQMAQLRATAGVSTRSDPVQAQARVEGAKANLIQIKSLSQQARQRVRTLIGSLVPETIDALPDPQAESLEWAHPPDPDMLPEVLAAQAEQRAAAAQLLIAKAQRWPTISLEASINRSINGVNPSTLQRNGSYRALMLNLSSVLFQGGALNAQVSAASRAMEASRQQIEMARLNSSDQARVFREQALGAKQSIAILVQRRKSIEQARDIYRDQYKLGTRSIIDLLNAEQEFYQAQTEEQTTRHEFWSSVVNYVGATGQAREFYGLNHRTVQGIDLLP
ncbi:TolC family outer membrane protein [Paraburkholderia hayleyella]|uniref:TolC family outer membrane protein n=1 Tax=Paraburkholderia hayleyella TaxID=2152889 RepID=UPI001580D67B|nr:TolC family outer membrane protein [Paraburkholderia hayleyella]